MAGCQPTCRLPGKLRWNQGCSQMPATPMRCAGAATRMRDSRSVHSDESCRAGGMSYCALHILCGRDSSDVSLKSSL